MRLVRWYRCKKTELASIENIVMGAIYAFLIDQPGKNDKPTVSPIGDGYEVFAIVLAATYGEWQEKNSPVTLVDNRSGDALRSAAPNDEAILAGEIRR
jgi:hypothetical protein